ncbi:MAG: hypothetical protein EP344_19855 [Bacteroidetes bacterium]|nr:MAG: hypothetical protein EP344_19855 [Bacteroidota bacterium]
MKTPSNYQTTLQTPATTGFTQTTENSPKPQASFHMPDRAALVTRPFGLLTDTAAEAIVQGIAPDLSQVCADLYTALATAGTSASAIQFISILKNLRNPDPAAMRRFMKNPQSRYVLVQNDLLKVVLIRWAPGEYSGVHGHAKGGCVFKVLQGRVEEKRYEPGTKTRPLAVSRFTKGGMAYIDDEMAYHDVGNPYDAMAISLHAYTPGIRK